MQPQDRFRFIAGIPIACSTSDERVCFLWVHKALSAQELPVSTRSWPPLSFYIYSNSLQAQAIKMKFKKNQVSLEENSDILQISS